MYYKVSESLNYLRFIIPFDDFSFYQKYVDCKLKYYLNKFLNVISNYLLLLNNLYYL